MKSTPKIVLLAVVCGCFEEVVANFPVDKGVHSSYQKGTQSMGFFFCDASSLVKVDGNLFVNDDQDWRSYGTAITVETGSMMRAGYPNYGALGYSYISTWMQNTSVRLMRDSNADLGPYTRTTWVLSSVQLDNSNLYIGSLSNVSMFNSNLQLQDSTMTMRVTKLILRDSMFSLSSSTLTLGDLSELQTKAANANVISSMITTGKGCAIDLATKSLLSANPINLTIKDYSSFSMGPGANLYVVGSNSSITIGKRAELSIIGICFFQGTLVIPDYTVKVIGSGNLPAGFTCMTTKSALKQFISKMGH